MKTTSIYWATGLKGTVGIVTCIDEHNKTRKIYISPVDGFNEAVDTKTIEELGGKLTAITVKGLYDFFYDEAGKLR